MATTTNNGWTTPNDSDPFKDGALAIRTLGNGIDTSVGTGLLAWTTYTPTITTSTGSITSKTINQAKYSVLGKWCHIILDLTIVTNGTGGGVLGFTLPSGAQAKSIYFTGAGRENALTGSMLQVHLPNTSSASIFTYNNTYPGATNARILASITYEVA